ncbi:MAG: PLDc N-terminal domain-containing protein [Actinomycetota bacterium]|jgi:hypothetical protein|nr:PLDc N-terminal domain-containing protein [Actinomycetota bacterium]
MELGSWDASVLIAIVVFSIAELAVMIWGLVDLIKRPVAQVRWANKGVWGAINVLINTFVGTIIYFVFGRIPAPIDDSDGVGGADAAGTKRAVDSLYGGSDS